MEYSTKLSLGSLVSIVICPMDDYLGEPARIRSCNIKIPYCTKKPIFKEDGFVVFCGLKPDEYHIEIQSENYLDEKIQFSVYDTEAGSQITYIQLKPKPSYAFKTGATLIRMTVCDKENNPVTNALIEAKVTSSDCLKGKIAKAFVKSGESEIYLSSITGKISIGDQFVVGLESDKEEVFIIEEQLEGLRHYRTKLPFKYDHDRGSSIMSVVNSRTDNRGEAVIYFRSVPVKKFKIKIAICYKEKIVMQEIEVEEGKTLYIGKLKI